MFKGFKNTVLALLKTKVVLNLLINFVSTVSLGADLLERQFFAQVIMVFYGRQVLRLAHQDPPNPGHS